MSRFHFLTILSLFGCVAQLSTCFKVENNKLVKDQVQDLLSTEALYDLKYNLIPAEISAAQNIRQSTDNVISLVKFEKNGKKYSLKLDWRNRPVFTSTTLIWLIKFDPNQNGNYTYKVVDQKDQYFDGIFVENNDIMANFLMHYDKNQQKIIYSGIIGFGADKQVINSLSEKWKIFITSENYEKLVKKNVKNKLSNSEKKSRSMFSTVEDFVAIEKSDRIPSILYIKIVPVVDYELFKLLKENIQNTLKYVTTFWNMIDMLFSKLDSLKIQISLTGIVIATDEDALSFIDKSRDKMNLSKINAFEFLEEARMYFYENFIKDTGFTNYDSIFVMTALKTQPTAGMSYIGRICNRLYSTAFIQDDANYLGLHSAAHELGHLLNFFHDGSDEAKDCKPYLSDGESTVMASAISAAKSFVWSQCSKNSLNEFIKIKAAKCLFEKNRTK